MNNMSLKEKAVLAVAGVVILYIIAIVLWFASQEAAWKSAAKQYDRECARYEKECRLISEKQKWSDMYESEKAQMPTFAKGTQVDFKKYVSGLAKDNSIVLDWGDDGSKVEKDDVVELSVPVRWEGALESLVKFMYALENASDGMYDVENLSLRPSSKKGYLKGSFTLTCAYMREE